MSTDNTQQNGQRWATLGLAILFLAAAGFAGMQKFRADELDLVLANSRAEAGKQQALMTGLATNIKTLTDKIAALEAQQKDAASLKALVAAAEPQIGATLEAVVNAKTAKPDAKAAALAGMGVVGQAAHGANHEAALALHNRALTLDAGNCAARLGLSLGGVKDVEIPANCSALLPAAAPAAPAAEAKAAPAEAKAAPEKPAAPAAAQPAAKN